MWAVGRSFGPVREEIRRSRPPRVSHIQIAGVNIALLGISPHGSKTMARWVEGFHGGLNGIVFDRERDGLRKAVSCP